MNEMFEMDTRLLVRGVLRRWRGIALAAFLGAALALCATFWLGTPMYESSVLFHVGGPEELSRRRDLVDSCIVVLDTGACLEEVAQQAQSRDDLRRMLTAQRAGETEFFRVTASSSDPQQAKAVADAVAAVLPQRIDGLLEGVELTVADPPVLAEEAIMPKYLMNSVIGFAVGFLLSTIAAVFQMALKTKRKT